MRLLKTFRIVIDVSSGKAALPDGGSPTTSGAVCIAEIRGADVSVREISDRDPVLGRIMRNDALLKTRYSDRVCYVAKDPVLELTGTLDGIHVAGFVIGDGGADVEAAVADEERRAVSWEGVKGDAPLRKAVCGWWYKKLKMPLLVFYLCILLLNFFCYQSVGRKYEERRRLLEASERRSRTETEATERQRKMIAEFMRASSAGYAFSFDRLASCVPEGVRLTLAAQGEDGTFRIRGEACDTGSVTEFAERLRGHFGGMRIRNLGKIPGRNIYGFELNLSL